MIRSVLLPSWIVEPSAAIVKRAVLLVRSVKLLLSLVPNTAEAPKVLPLFTNALPLPVAKPHAEAVCKQIVPVASGSVIVRAAVATPVIVKLLLAGVLEVPAKNSLPNGNALEPRSMVPADTGSKVVLMATPLRLDSAVFAPPPPPPKQLPVFKQIVAVPAAGSGNVYTVFWPNTLVITLPVLVLVALLNTSVPANVPPCPNLTEPADVSTVSTLVLPCVNTLKAVDELLEFFIVIWPVLPTPNSTAPNPEALLPRTSNKSTPMVVSAS